MLYIEKVQPLSVITVCGLAVLSVFIVTFFFIVRNEKTVKAAGFGPWSKRLTNATRGEPHVDLSRRQRGFELQPTPAVPFLLSVCLVRRVAEGGLDFCSLRSLPNYLALSLNGRLPSIILCHMATTGISCSLTNH